MDECWLVGSATAVGTSGYQEEGLDVRTPPCIGPGYATLALW